MHTLLVHQAFVSPQEAGGTRHFELARHAIARGHAFSIVASDLSYLTGQRVGNSREASDVDGVQVLRAYTAPTLHRSFSWRIVSFLSFMASSVRTALQVGSVDLVMGTSPPIFQALSAMVIAAVRRRPFLLEVRDLWPDFAIELGVLKNPAAIRASRELESLLYARADHIVINSPAYRDYLLERGLPAEKITLISNGVDPSLFDPESRGENLRRRWQVEDRFVVTYAGALGLANDIPTILRAADRLRGENGIHFMLVGDGKERSNLQRQAEQLALPNVSFTGALPKTEMPQALAASDVCLATLQNIPMFKTTYPNKVFDYMAAARPTVLGIDGVIREVIDTAGGGLFVPPGDDAALAEAVLRLYRNPDEARAMGQAARAHVVEHFDRRRQAEQFVELLARVGAGRA